MESKINLLNKLSEKRIKYFLLKWDEMTWYKWSKTYFKEIRNEIQEAENELNTHQVYLEDELWDVLWDYLCLLNSLKQEWKITSVNKVIERAYKKFSWRINIETWDYNGIWEEIKKQQKQELKNEIEKTE